MAAVRAEQVAGSLALSGIADDAARQGLARAVTAITPDAPLTVAALLAWHRAAVGPAPILATTAQSCSFTRAPRCITRRRAAL